LSGPEERKVAIATKDGINIYEHFAAAPFFIVLKAKGHQVVAREQRENPYMGRRKECGEHAACLRVAREVLPDVQVVISAGMGENAYVALLSRNILPLLTQERDIIKAVKLYLKGRLKEDPSLVRQAGIDRCF